MSSPISKSNRDFRVKNKIFDGQDRPGYWINGGEQVTNYFPWFINSGISVTIIDPADLKSWKNSASGDFNSVSTAVSRTYSYPTNTPEERQHVIDLLSNEVPDGHYVVLWTLQRTANIYYLPDEWAADSLYTVTIIFQVL